MAAAAHVRGLIAALPLLAALFGFAGSVQAAAPADPPRLDIEYKLIPQQPVTTGNKIEVLDFFWYGCPHCNKLQPALEMWRKTMPPDVEFKHVPVVLHDNWGPHARIYYTLKSLGLVEQLQQEVYRGYHVEELYMSKADVMADWAVKHGIDRDRWVAAYNSPEVTAQIEQAKALTLQYHIEGTPALVVDGRFYTSGGMVTEEPDLVPILQGLIKIARERRKGFSPPGSAPVPEAAPATQP